MHPREFFGPTIKKEIIGNKKCVVEVIKHHDFYLRLKLASIRKKLKENISFQDEKFQLQIGQFYWPKTQTSMTKCNLKMSSIVLEN